MLRRARLDPEQYRVAREKGTERAFTGKYWQTTTHGKYRCIGCGEVLFRSDDKFDAGCGWPSFSAPADEAPVEEERDTSLSLVCSLEEDCPSATNALHYARHVRRDALLRELSHRADELQRALKARHGIDEALAAVEEAAAWTRGADGYRPTLITEAADAHLDDLDREHRGETTSTPRWSTGLDEIDAILQGGPRSPNLVLIGGRPGMGKTALGLQIADEVAQRGGVVHVWSGEMSAKELAGRRLADWASVSAGRIAQPRRLSDHDWIALSDSLHKRREEAHRM